MMNLNFIPTANNNVYAINNACKNDGKKLYELRLYEMKSVESTRHDILFYWTSYQSLSIFVVVRVQKISKFLFPCYFYLKKYLFFILNPKHV